MTPKEKSKELVDKFEKILKLDYENYYKYDFGHCRKCALIAVDELIITEFKTVESLLKIIYDNKIKLVISFNEDYWQEVKKEINKL
jgi:hypothetical protein